VVPELSGIDLSAATEVDGIALVGFEDAFFFATFLFLDLDEGEKREECKEECGEKVL
jgi:hypothetical protein